MIRELINSINDDKKIEAIICTMDAKDIINILKQDYLKDSQKRIIVGKILNTKNNLKDNEFLFFRRFIMLHDLDKIKDINNLEEEVFHFIQERIYRFHSIEKILNLISSDRKEKEGTALQFLLGSEDSHYYQKLISEADYSLFFYQEVGITSVSNLTSDSFITTTNDFIKIQGDKEKIFFAYFKSIFELMQAKDFNTLDIINIQVAITKLNCQHLLNQINVLQLSKEDFSTYEIIISRFKEFLTEDYLKVIYLKKESYYTDNNSIVLDTFVSLNSNDCAYKQFFLESINNQSFKDNTFFVTDTKENDLDDILLSLYLNGYKVNKLLKQSFFENDKLNAQQYLIKQSDIIDISSLNNFLHPDDYFTLQLLNIKYSFLNNDFIEFFIDNLDVLINKNGRLSEDGLELLLMNYKF